MSVIAKLGTFTFSKSNKLLPFLPQTVKCIQWLWGCSKNLSDSHLGKICVAHRILPSRIFLLAPANPDKIVIPSRLWILSWLRKSVSVWSNVVIMRLLCEIIWSVKPFSRRWGFVAQRFVLKAQEDSLQMISSDSLSLLSSLLLVVDKNDKGLLVPLTFLN